MKADTIVAKNEQSFKNLERLIKTKEIEILKDVKRKKISLADNKSEIKDDKGKDGNASQYRSKIQNLRAEVEKNMKKNQQKEKKVERLPKVEAEIKTPKPKIKILM